MASLPYVTAAGNIEKALTAIKSAAVPERVSQDFVKTILQIKGGSGNQMTSYLKKIGFVNADGSPSELYKKFRNPSSTGSAAAEALRTGYAPLYVRNEYMHKLNDEQLRGLIIEETGQGDDSSAVALIFSAIKYLKKFATYNTQQTSEIAVQPAPQSLSPDPNAPHNGQFGRETIGLNLGYTINLNLPATSDISVFNAIFQSLRENLLRNE
jgi:hypothetical protein